MALRIFAVLVLAFCSVILAQDGINTGQGLHCLLFPGNGGVELANYQNRTTLSDVLPLSFTFSAWVMLPNAPGDGYYKTIVAHWDSGPGGRTFHNRYAHFNFQVQASGTLNFFMGNGGPSAYGILRGTTTLNQGQWTYVAFSVNTPQNQTNPDSARVYAYSSTISFTSWSASWTSGTRQIPQAARGRNLFLGDYFNQDMDNKYWRGYMDEVTFWSGVRTDAQLQQFLQRVIPSSTPGLLAYYRFNDGAGLILQDSSPNKFDGRLARISSNTTAPLWRVSGAKIHVDVSVSPQEIATIYLPGLSPRGSLGFTYAIESLPQLVAGGSGVGRLLADGQFITSVPFGLISNQVTFETPNATGYQVSFTYYGTYNLASPSAREADPTIMYVQIGNQPCALDACGKCNGDNSTCTCLPLPYNGYNLLDIERILLLYEIEQTLDLLSTLEGQVQSVMHILSQHQATELQLIIDEVQTFNQKCLLKWCSNVDKYLDVLSAIGPQ